MDDVLAVYYRGIAARIRGEVDFINAIFKGHPGVKGEGNEGVLREFLTRFLPNRYGIGTGVVVDHRGNQSRQCDVVLYDRHLYPSLLSLTNVHLFPVDLVYGVIEIKTTLDAKESRAARENIRSVRTLSALPDPFTVATPRVETSPSRRRMAHRRWGSSSPTTAPRQRARQSRRGLRRGTATPRLIL